jgi:hypothetical protein
MNNPTTPSRRDIITFLGSTTALSLLPGTLHATDLEGKENQPHIPYTVADVPWPQLLGNHRVRIHVGKSAPSIFVHLPWRRIDSEPELKELLLFDTSGLQIKNIAIVALTAEAGDIVFEAKVAGEYLLYYLPQAPVEGKHSATGPKGSYRHAENLQEPVWLEKVRSLKTRSPQLLRQTQARVLEFQARTQLDSFYPMEVPATAAELATLLKKHDQSILIFPEDRYHPIKMSANLPLVWVQGGPREKFEADALLNEFFVFQIGVYGAKMRFPSALISVSFEDLLTEAGGRIPSSACECINTGGLDDDGKEFRKSVEVHKGKVTALWCGIKVPLDAKPSVYMGKLQVSIDKASFPIQIVLNVQKDFIQDGGADQPSRLSRIQWLNSTIGIDNTIPPPYTSLQVKGSTVSCLGREVTVGDNGFPQSVKVADRELLSEAIQLKVYSGSNAISWKSTNHAAEIADDKVTFGSNSEAEGFSLIVQTTMEFDGGIGCDVKMVCRRTTSISDVALEVLYKNETVPYAVGMGLKGGKKPRSWSWRWTDQPQAWKDQGSNLEYFLWLGDVSGGLYCRLKEPLGDWRNSGKGEVGIFEKKSETLFKAKTGSRVVKAGDELHFSFRLLPTPVKPLTSEHWKERYAHAYRPPAALRALEATVINIHQGTMPNLYINYPFLNLDLLTPYVSEAHSIGMKVKLYYTMRELTTRLPELWAFRSLGDEIYRVGGTQGQGDAHLDFWLQEHLHDPYAAGWTTPTSTGDIDTSLRVHSDSRLGNFYLEGLRWLLDNILIDGIYLDEIGYSRNTMQRVRRVLRRRPGAMIDMHGNDVWWSCNCPIGYYMEHLPYIDRLWLGESFDPDSPPDFWLIEMSGLPFGLSSDLLEKPNPWRGMLFGMTDRALYGGYSPTPIWKLWDSFGIETATMIGWWEDKVPIKSNKSNVLVTVYRNQKASLVAIASWSKQTEWVQLDVDWKLLGLNRENAVLVAPGLENLQIDRRFSINEPISVPPGGGYLLILQEKEPN